MPSFIGPRTARRRRDAARGTVWLSVSCVGASEQADIAAAVHTPASVSRCNRLSILLLRVWETTTGSANDGDTVFRSMGCSRAEPRRTRVN
jgi:hypothetical protein